MSGPGGSPFAFSSRSLGGLHLKFQAVLWVVGKIIGLTRPLNLFSPLKPGAFISFSFLIKTQVRVRMKHLLKMGHGGHGAGTEQRAQWTRGVTAVGSHASRRPLRAFSPLREQWGETWHPEHFESLPFRTRCCKAWHLL